MRRAHHAYIDRHRARATDAHHFAFFQHAQQACLQRQRHFANFVEEEGAAMCCFEQARVAAAPGAGKGAFFMAEEFRFQQRLGDCAAIDRDKWLAGLAARAFAVNGLRHEFLAGAGLPR